MTHKTPAKHTTDTKKSTGLRLRTNIKAGPFNIGPGKSGDYEGKK